MKLVRRFEKFIAAYLSKEYKIFSTFYFKSNRAKNGPLISELMRVVLESTWRSIFQLEMPGLESVLPYRDTLWD